jgi:flagellar M-ring protein FliF
VRHQQTVSDANKSTDAPATVSVQNNLPNPEGQGGSSNGTSGNRQEENTTFEIDKTVRTITHDVPSIKKISMAVLVDGITAPGTNGRPVWRELSQTELDQVASLVKTAVGFDAKRGDHVQVVNMRFSSPEDLGDPASPGTWLQFGKADLIWLITTGTIALVALFSLGFVVRPLALKLASGVPAPAPNAAALPGPAQTIPPALLTDANAEQAKLLLAANPPADPADKDTMLNVANVQGEIRASSIQSLGKQVQTRPEAALMVMRGWLAEKAG